MEMKSNNMRNSCFTRKIEYFAGIISYYLREGLFLVHVTVVISSIYERVKVDL